MKVVVHDASILIDLALSECVEAWFATGIETWTSDLIYPREVDRPAQRKILDAYAAAGVLRVAPTSGAAEELVEEQTRLGRGLSLADISVFRLTRQLGADTVLATGDSMLRKVAEKEKIKACGILGLFDRMVLAEGDKPAALPHAVACQKLELLLTHPECRLPRDKCQAKIRLWSAHK